VLKGGRRASEPHRRGGRTGWLARGGALLALGSLGSLAAALDRSRAADTILLNGEILLFQGVEQLEGSRPRREPSRPQFAQAVAVAEGGSIEVGKLADLIVLSQNLFHVPTERISDTRVLLTMMGGRIVFDYGDLVRP